MVRRQGHRRQRRQRQGRHSDAGPRSRGLYHKDGRDYINLSQLHIYHPKHRSDEVEDSSGQNCVAHDTNITSKRQTLKVQL